MEDLRIAEVPRRTEDQAPQSDAPGNGLHLWRVIVRRRIVVIHERSRTGSPDTVASCARRVHGTCQRHPSRATRVARMHAPGRIAICNPARCRSQCERGPALDRSSRPLLRSHPKEHGTTPARHNIRNRFPARRQHCAHCSPRSRCRRLRPRSRRPRAAGVAARPGDGLPHRRPVRGGRRWPRRLDGDGGDQCASLRLLVRRSAVHVDVAQTAGLVLIVLFVVVALLISQITIRARADANAANAKTEAGHRGDRGRSRRARSATAS